MDLAETPPVMAIRRPGRAALREEDGRYGEYLLATPSSVWESVSSFRSPEPVRVAFTALHPEVSPWALDTLDLAFVEWACIERVWPGAHCMPSAAVDLVWRLMSADQTGTLVIKSSFGVGFAYRAVTPEPKDPRLELTWVHSRIVNGGVRWRLPLLFRIDAKIGLHGGRRYTTDHTPADRRQPDQSPEPKQPLGRSVWRVVRSWYSLDVPPLSDVWSARTRGVVLPARVRAAFLRVHPEVSPDDAELVGQAFLQWVRIEARGPDGRAQPSIAVDALWRLWAADAPAWAGLEEQVGFAPTYAGAPLAAPDLVPLQLAFYDTMLDEGAWVLPLLFTVDERVGLSGGLHYRRSCERKGCEQDPSGVTVCLHLDPIRSA